MVMLRLSIVIQKTMEVGIFLKYRYLDSQREAKHKRQPHSSFLFLLMMSVMKT